MRDPKAVRPYDKREAVALLQERGGGMTLEEMAAVLRKTEEALEPVLDALARERRIEFNRASRWVNLMRA